MTYQRLNSNRKYLYVAVIALHHTALKILKGPSVVLMDKYDYIKRINEMLYDSNKF